MSRRFLSAAAISSALLLGACAPEVAERPSTDSTSRSLLAQPLGTGPVTPLAAATGAAPRPGDIDLNELGYDRGQADAPVKVIELSDYGCGYCRQFHQETFPTLVEEFIDTGMVEWKFMPFVAGMFENSLIATEAAECVLAQGAEPFEVLNGRLWERQREWKGSQEPESVLRTWVSEIGADVSEFDACLAGDVRLQRVASASAFAREVGVRGTPTFVVVGYPPIQGALPLEVFQEILNVVHADRVGPAQD